MRKCKIIRKRKPKIKKKTQLTAINESWYDAYEDYILKLEEQLLTTNTKVAVVSLSEM